MAFVQLALAIATSNPALQQYLTPSPEKSKSYEAGFKGALLDRRLTFNLTYYHQDFEGYLYYTFPTYYLKTGTSTSVSSVRFTTNADAVVDGSELILTARPVLQWTTTFNFNWTKGRLRNAQIPCNSSMFNGVIDDTAPSVAQFQAAGQSVALCKSNGSSSTGSPWTLNVQSEYYQPIAENVSALCAGWHR